MDPGHHVGMGPGGFFSASVISVCPAVEHFVGVVVHHPLVLSVAIGYDESVYGELGVAVGASHVGTARCRFGTVLAGYGP